MSTSTAKRKPVIGRPQLSPTGKATRIKFVASPEDEIDLHRLREHDDLPSLSMTVRVAVREALKRRGIKSARRKSSRP